MEPIVKVQMFGQFSAHCNGDPVIFAGDRGGNAQLLLQYLLMKQDRRESGSELMEKLSFDSEDGDAGILQESADALRSALAAVLHRDCVLATDGAVALDEAVAFAVDAETFESIVLEALHENENNERRLRLCMDALALYAGEFLPDSAGLAWVTPYVLRYQEMCYYCVKTAYRIYQAKHDLLPMVGLLQKVMAIYPLEEEFRILYISTLYSLDRIKEAVDEYDFFATLLYDELGIGPSEEMLALYKKITGTVNSFSSSIAFIRKDMNEEIKGRGAYYCNYQSFANTYRFVVRHIERSGQSAFLMLVTFADAGSNTVSLNKKMQKISLSFHNVLHEALRRGDVYARYSPTQFILLLMDIGEENCPVVSNRITEKFLALCKDKDVKMHFKIIPVADADITANEPI